MRGDNAAGGAMPGGTRPCSRCVKDPDFLAPEKIAALAAEIKIDPSLAAEEGIYKKRLKACNECEALSEKVLCSHCGCFIFFRARPEKNYCPHPLGNRWKKE